MGTANRLRKLWRWLPLSFGRKQYMRYLFLKMFPFLRNIHKLDSSHLALIHQSYSMMDEDKLLLVLPSAFKKTDQRKIILVAHDAHPHGGQYLVLHMAKYLKEALGFSVVMLVLGDGILMGEYAKYAKVYDLSGFVDNGKETNALLAEMYRQGYRYAFANTVISGQIIPCMKAEGFYVYALVHELPGLIQKLGLEDYARRIASAADRIIFPAEQVKADFIRHFDCEEKKTVICPQGLYRKNHLLSGDDKNKARLKLRGRFGLSETARVILSVGYADHRKGVDLFVAAGIELLRTNPTAYFLWVGHFDPAIEHRVRAMIRGAGLEHHFLFPGMDFDSDVYYAGADLYVLSSREDPFPSAVLEAMSAGLPVVAFRGAGGFTELVERAGVLVESLDVKALASAQENLLSSTQQARKLGACGATIVEQEFSFKGYMLKLLMQCSPLTDSDE